MLYWPKKKYSEANGYAVLIISTVYFTLSYICRRKKERAIVESTYENYGFRQTYLKLHKNHGTSLCLIKTILSLIVIYCSQVTVWLHLKCKAEKIHATPSIRITCREIRSLSNGTKIPMKATSSIKTCCNMQKGTML